MPYTKVVITDFEDAIEKIIQWTTDKSIHGADAWELMRHQSWPQGTILQAHGWQPGEKLYIGLMTTAMYEGSSYRNWFNSSFLANQDALLSKFIYNPNGLNLPHGTPVTVAGDRVAVYGVSYEWKRDEKTGITQGIQKIDNTTTYIFSGADIFKGNSKALFFGAFKQYSSGLPWHEQAGASTPPVTPKMIKYYIARSSSGTSGPYNWTPPTYPGVGFPAIGGDIGGFLDGTATMWLVKDRHRLIVVIQNRDYWDVAQAGFLVPNHTPTEYSFPAVVIGSHSGVLPVIEPYTYPNATCVTLESGYKFNYSLSNMTLSHGNLTYPASYWNGVWRNEGCLSSVQAMLPDGTWRCFANWGIRQEVIYHTSCGTCPSYYFGNLEPERPSNLEYTVYPAYNELSELTNIYVPDVQVSQYQLEPVRLVQNEINHQNPKLSILGDVWRMYWPSMKVLRYGEHSFGGKKYLIIPSGWEGRKFHYPHGNTHVMDPSILRNTQKRIDRKSETMNCVIRLED